MKRTLVLLAALFVSTFTFSQKIVVRAAKEGDGIISIMSYNIRHGKGMDGKVDFDRIAKEISLVSPDVIALQEVDVKTNRIGGVPSDSVIAAKAGGYNHYFSSAMDFNGGKYGNAVLSKTPAISVTPVPLKGTEEPRVMLVAEFENYFFCSLHLSLDSTSRIEAAKTICETAEKMADGKLFFIAGDFNTSVSSVEMNILLNHFDILSPYQLKTFPSDKPDRTLDYVMVLKNSKGKKLVREFNFKKTLSSWVQPEPMASDHRPVFVVIIKGDILYSATVKD